MAKRLFDLVFSSVAICLTIPLFPVISLAIKLDTPGPILFLQPRAGLRGRPFSIYKFRTMVVGAAEQGPITVREDPRMTRSGVWLRRFKIDEWPTFFNVLLGHMSVVGPRPEVLTYTLDYTAEQRRVLDVRPGITDLGTLAFDNEADLLDDVDSASEKYFDSILAKKLKLNLEYVDRRSMALDMKIILKTVLLIAGRR